METVEKQFFPFPSGERMEFDSGEKRGIDFENCCELLFLNIYVEKALWNVDKRVEKNSSNRGFIDPVYF